ncbi:energy transducer TonB [Mucilaginibacter sp. CAU 1740]|uniref:energy transducer TonB n=1 Tax=Mucilaginibacter sp. CAU 1740 TaxID=3140365 RepID=UPI00325A5601
MRWSLVLIFLSLSEITAKAQNNTPLSIDTSAYKVYDYAVKVDKQPEFPGGLDAFFSFIKKNLRWPIKSQKIEGRIFVEVTITKNGSLINPVIKRGLSEEQDKEALRLVKKSPKWKPAMLKGKAIDFKYYLIIPFKRDDE